MDRVDASSLKQDLPKAVVLKSSIIDLDMPTHLLEQQLRLFITTFKKVRKTSPNTSFHFDTGFVKHTDLIQKIAVEYGALGYVNLDEPMTGIQVVIDSLSTNNVNGILIDIEQIQANELPIGLPKAIRQGLKEAILFTNSEAKQLDFELADSTEVTRLRRQRNQSSKEPIDSDAQYIQLISGSMSITQRQAHIWNAILPIPWTTCSKPPNAPPNKSPNLLIESFTPRCKLIASNLQ